MNVIPGRPVTSRALLCCAAVAALLLALGARAALAVEAFPSAMRVQDVKAGEVTLHVRSGGSGPAVLMLHGFGDTGDMWAPLATAMIGDHRVIVPDLRGMGLSSHPAGGYDKKTQAQDVAAVLDRLGVEAVVLVTHDIGNMVGYAFAAQYPQRVSKWVVMDLPLAGMGHWEHQVRNPAVWHFNFRGPDVERLVKGRERIYLDRFYNEFSATPSRIDEKTRAHYARLYALPGAMHSAFNQFAAFAQDAEDNKVFVAKGKLTMPILAIGGDESYGSKLAEEIAFVATNVTAAAIPNSGHWIMEEQPAAAVKLIQTWVDKGKVD